jgi:3-oxoacyl-[acyl-carrier-protein] synthase-3
MGAQERQGWLVMERAADVGRAPHASRLESAGRKLPATTLTTEHLMASTRHRTRIDLERLTGIHERRVSTGDESSLSLAVAAAEDCLRRSRHRAADLDVVISCSITKSHDELEQWFEPSMASTVAAAIGADRAVTFDVANACAGMLTGVFVLNNWIRLGVARTGMVVSGEYISQLGRNAAQHVRHVLSRELASLTLGDAGAALLLERAPEGRPGIAVAGFTTLADHSRLCLAYPAAHDPGARMFTNSRGIHKAAIAVTPDLLQEALDAAGIGIGDVDVVIPHQTSARAIRKGMAEVAEALGGAPRHDAVVTVDRYGNTASTTHTVALVEELQAGRIRAGDRIALVALASGLEVGVVLLTLDEEVVARHGNDG